MRGTNDAHLPVYFVNLFNTLTCGIEPLPTSVRRHTPCKPRHESSKILSPLRSCLRERERGVTANPTAALSGCTMPRTTVYKLPPRVVARTFN